MIENEVYCYINGFLKGNTSKKTSYIVRNKKIPVTVFIFNLRNKKYLCKSNLQVLWVKED